MSMTRDKAIATSSRIFTHEQIGPKRHRTKEGYLVCEEVPVARTGTMQYHPTELKDDNGNAPFVTQGVSMVHVYRSPEEVFKPESMASLMGKPIVDDHPPVDVTPKNWRQLAGGIVFNPRRGTGAQQDLLIADLMVTDEGLIQAIDDGKVEVSCGYDPEYFSVNDDKGEPLPGQAEQRNILYNHLALVASGRCGSRCSIGDQDTLKLEKQPMARSRTRRGILGKALDRAFKAFQSKDEKAFDEAMNEVEEAVEDGETSEFPNVEVHNHVPQAGEVDAMPPWVKSMKDSIDAIGRKVKAMDEGFEEFKKEKKEGETKDADDPTKIVDGEPILGELEMEAPPGTGDAAKKAKDSAYLADSFQDTVAKAEIIAPGVHIPAFDKAAPPAKSFEIITGLRRTALDLAFNAPATRGHIDAVLGGKTLDSKTMKPGVVRTTFNAVAAMRSTDNKPGTTQFPNVGGGTPVKDKKFSSIGDINKFADERYRGNRKSA